MSAGSYPFVSWLQGPKSGENQEEEEQGAPQVKKKACLYFCQQRGASHPTMPATALRKQPSKTCMLGNILFLNEQMGELKNGMLVLLSFHKQYVIHEVDYYYIITYAPPNSTVYTVITRPQVPATYIHI